MSAPVFVSSCCRQLLLSSALVAVSFCCHSLLSFSAPVVVISCFCCNQRPPAAEQSVASGRLPPSYVRCQRPPAAVFQEFLRVVVDVVVIAVVVIVVVVVDSRSPELSSVIQPHGRSDSYDMSF